MSLPRWKRRAFLLLISVASCIAKGRAFASPFENLAQLSIVRSTSSVPLGLWERGHLRMYLEQNGYGCQLTMKKTPLRGELSLKLEVEERHAVVTTIVDAKGLKPAAFPPCLSRILRNVQLEKLAPHFVWTGTLRYTSMQTYEIGVQSLYGKLGELPLTHVVAAALEQSSDCMDRFWKDPREISIVLGASFDVDDKGALANLDVKLSTAGFEEYDMAACVKDQLSGITFPTGNLTGAKLRIALLRPTTKPPDPKIPTLIMGRKP